MSALAIDPAQALDLEPDEIATAAISDSNRVLVELIFATPAAAAHAHDRMLRLRGGRGLQLNLLPTGVEHPRADPRLRPMAYKPPSLTPSQIRALPDGTRVSVIWCGGNGPHTYTLRHRSYDGAPPFDIYGCSVLPCGSEVDSGLIMAWNHEEVWGGRILEEVRLPDA